MSKTINRQSGFAIGTILLAVILIAAIVSAIAIASRGSSTQSGREQARVQASTLLQQGANLRSGFERMVANGTDKTSITANAANDQLNNCDNNNFPANTTCLYHTTEGGTTVQQVSTQAFHTANANNFSRYHLLRSVNVTGVGTFTGGASTGASAVMVIGDLKLDVCRQINNQVNGMLLTANPPLLVTATTLAAVGAILEGDGTTLEVTLPVGADFINGQVLQAWPEACVQLDAGAADDAREYLWYKVVSE
ncbi:MAG: hypothetical protein EYC62_09255 [Alphaproteobacteria bacterium]|nr:MAG: hypothetical protein EYC62_09255 [Alphaproteobacteria bacterium]